ncbi:MAG: hypothetical protein LUC20_05095 [Oscillospiraceae bacterium]|nr:hypothetical protein [Oscillospiraceae bacterium]
MNKYKDFSRQKSAARGIEHAELEAARMRKPGYRRKMRRSNNKYARKAKSISQ